jgi:hypothetical protein
MIHEADADLVRRAVDGEAAARHALVLRLGPVVQRGRGVERSEVLDLTQQILLLLFDRDSRVLRSWDPGRGLALANFVGLVEREARAILRSGRSRLRQRVHAIRCELASTPESATRDAAASPKAAPPPRQGEAFKVPREVSNEGTGSRAAGRRSRGRAGGVRATVERRRQ